MYHIDGGLFEQTMEKVKMISLDYNQILEYQADRYPYLFFDRIDEVIPGQRCKGYKNLTHNEWFFPIHFPGDPCMPGFLQAEALTQVCALCILTLEGNKGKQVVPVTKWYLTQSCCHTVMV